MRRQSLILAVALALAGCASVRSDKAPVCDGKHRRPANLYGSVLDPSAPPAPAPSVQHPEKLSALPPSYPSCRA